MWGSAALLLCIVAVAVVAGIHTRSAWAVSVCRFFCVCCLLAGAVVCARFFATMNFSIFRESFPYGSLLFQNSLMLVVAFAVHVPILAAWYKYFGSSRVVAASFPGGEPQTSSPLPLGVGLLTLLCWIFLAAKAMFFLCLWFGNGRDHVEHMWRILLIISPGIVFPAMILWLIRKPGTHIALLFGLLCGWFFLAHMTASGALVRFFPNDPSINLNMGVLFSMFTLLGMTPMPTLLLGILLAALGWRFVSLPEEARWFARRDGLENILSLPLFVMLYLCGVWLSFALLGFADFFKAAEKGIWLMGAACLFASMLAALCLWIVFTRLGTGRSASNKPDRLFFAGSIACALLYMGVYLENAYLTANFEWVLRGALPHTVLYVGLSVYGLVLLSRGTAPGYRVPAMPLATGCFLVFAVCTLGSEALRAAANLTLYATAPEAENSFFLQQNPMFRYEAAGFWLAWLACPAVAIGMLRKRLKSLGAFYAVCGVWLLALFADQTLVTGVTAFSRGNPFESMLFFIKIQVAAAAIVLFMVYCAGSRELAIWRAGQQGR